MGKEEKGSVQEKRNLSCILDRKEKIIFEEKGSVHEFRNLSCILDRKEKIIFGYGQEASD
jgi:hypothetical protein